MADGAQLGAKLDSWKEIAAFLGREVRTAQRWERLEGLPIHRLEHRKRGSVYAYTLEIEAWMVARTPGVEASAPAAAVVVAQPVASPAPRGAYGRWLAILLSGAVVAGVGVWLRRQATAAAPGTLPAMVSFGGPRPRIFLTATSEGGAPDLIRTGASPQTVLLTRGGHEIYVANQADRSITVLNAESLRPETTLRLANAAGALAATTDGSRVFVASTDGTGISIIDTGTRQVSSVGLSGGVADLALSPDGRWLYLAQRYDGLARLDLARMEVTHLATSACPSALALTPDGRTLFVGYQCGGPSGRRGHDSIGVFDVASQRFTGTFAGDVAMVANVMAVSPDGNELWSTSGDACTAAYDHVGCAPGVPNWVYIFATASGKLLGRIALNAAAVNQITFFSGGRRALLGGEVVDTTRREVLEAYPEFVGGVAIAPNGARIFASLPKRNAVGVFTTSNSSCAPPSEYLDAWWRGDGSAADAASLMAGRPSPGVTYAPGRMGQGFAFDEHSLVNFGHDVALARAWHDGFTVAAWVKPTGAPRGSLLSKGAGNTGGWSLGFDASGRMEACFGAGEPCLKALPPFGQGQWHFIALTGDARGVEMWVDGAEAARMPRAQTVVAAKADLIAGAGFRGVLDEIMVYSRRLDADGQRALYRLPQCLAEAGP